MSFGTRGVRLCVLAVLAALVSPGPARAGDARRLVRFLPTDAAIIAGVDVARARKTPLAAAIAPRFLASDRGARLARAGLDPVKDVDTVLASLAPSDAFTPGRAFVVMEGRFARVKLDRLFDTPPHAVTHGAVTYWTDDDTAAAVVGNRLLLAAAARIEPALDTLAGPRVRTTGARALAASVDARHHAWVAWELDAAARMLARAKGIEADAITLGLTSPGDVAIEMRARMPDRDSADAAVTSLRASMSEKATGLPARGLSSMAESLAVALAETGGAAFARVTATVRRGEIGAFVRAIAELLNW